MKVIIAGGRDVVDINQVFRAVYESKLYPITTVISGGARGADRLGEQWAQYYGIMIERVIPDWILLGKKAGFVRNNHMATKHGAEALIALWDGKSRGTLDMIQRGIFYKLRVFIWRVDLGRFQDPSEIPVDPKLHQKI